MELTGRFAPTPSGYLHLGNAFCALVAYLSVKSRGGRFLLRVEDLDRLRLPDMPERTAALLCDLAWLGITFDSGLDPSEYQSARGDVYAAAIEKLRSRGLVYPCWCSRAELHAATAPHLSDGRYAYSGTCYKRFLRGDPPSDKPPALRVHVPDETVGFDDLVAGHYEENLTLGGDFIVRRSDGVFAYQLAVAVDDALTGVTEVVRGRDLLSSTPAQIWLLRELGLPVPQYAHIPLLTAPDGRRLSKRDGDDSLASYRERGYRPEDVLGLLAAAAGQTDRAEPVSMAELLACFDITKIPKTDVAVGTLPPRI